MSESERQDMGQDREMIESVWAEARDLIRRLEGSTVQRLAVAAGEYKIEIERGGGAPTSSPPAGDQPPAGPLSEQPVAGGAGPGPGGDPRARMASGGVT